jgi:5-methyltetrahydropteroyltriglutamate--homocysteine methyltransferase
MPGLIDTTSSYVEPPELVAHRLSRYAEAVGRERVIAGTACGFATFASLPSVHPTVAYAKLAALSEGAAIASRRFWP